MIAVTDAGKKALEKYFKGKEASPLRIYLRAS
jgi:hypothetical protein